MSKGERVPDIFRIIESNTRFPTLLMGDLEAQLGGCLMGRDLVTESGELFQNLDTVSGGWGASAHADGAGPFRSNAHGDR